VAKRRVKGGTQGERAQGGFNEDKYLTYEE